MLSQGPRGIQVGLKLSGQQKLQRRLFIEPNIPVYEKGQFPPCIVSLERSEHFFETIERFSICQTEYTNDFSLPNTGQLKYLSDRMTMHIIPGTTLSSYKNFRLLARARV
jgi:hypothetical protein